MPCKLICCQNEAASVIYDELSTIRGFNGLRTERTKSSYVRTSCNFQMQRVLEGYVVTTVLERENRVNESQKDALCLWSPVSPTNISWKAVNKSCSTYYNKKIIYCKTSPIHDSWGLQLGIFPFTHLIFRVCSYSVQDPFNTCSLHTLKRKSREHFWPFEPKWIWFSFNITIVPWTW